MNDIKTIKKIYQYVSKSLIIPNIMSRIYMIAFSFRKSNLLCYNLKRNQIKNNGDPHISLASLDDMGLPFDKNIKERTNEIKTIQSHITFKMLRLTITYY